MDITVNYLVEFIPNENRSVGAMSRWLDEYFIYDHTKYVCDLATVSENTLDQYPENIYIFQTWFLKFEDSVAFKLARS